MKKKEQGFTLVEVLLSIIAVAVVVFVGFYVYDQSRDDKDAATTSTSKPAATAKPATSDKIAGWTTFSTPGGSFSFQYPSSWKKNVCDANAVLLGPTEASAGKCQTDGVPQVVLSSTKSDQREANKLDPADYPDLTTQSVKADGVEGTKQSGTLQSSSEAFVGPQNGSKEVVYTFYKNGTTYIAHYIQAPDFTDVLSDFNLLVTKTLKFTN